MSLAPTKAVEALRSADAALQAMDPRPFPIPCTGLEPVIAGAMLGLDRQDWVFPGLRERIGAVLRSCPVERLADGHAGARPYRFAPVSKSPSTRMLHACGMAATLETERVLCFIGQGSTATGSFHEALNLASQKSLNLIFLCHAWDLDQPDSPLPPQLAASLTELASAHGLSTLSVDGHNAKAVKTAVAKAHKAGGPWLIEARLTRSSP